MSVVVARITKKTHAGLDIKRPTLRALFLELLVERFLIRIDVGRCDYFFFFQAEDGIRDVAVTGVQTCALPISTVGSVKWSTVRRRKSGSGTKSASNTASRSP